MDKELRLSFQVLETQVLELNATIRRLQELTEEHRQSIKKLQQPLRDPARVHPSR